MYQGLFAKFSQNAAVLTQLLRTETRFLRYENGSDIMWGIGDDKTGLLWINLIGIVGIIEIIRTALSH